MSSGSQVVDQEPKVCHSEMQCSFLILNIDLKILVWLKVGQKDLCSIIRQLRLLLLY